MKNRNVPNNFYAEFQQLTSQLESTENCPSN
jgi:hypothetical protein